MKKVLVVFLFFLAAYGFSQDYSIKTEEEEKIDGSITVTRKIKLVTREASFPWLELDIFDVKNGNKDNKFFIFSYIGKDWRFYSSMTMNIDGKIFTLKFNPYRNVMSGSVSEICSTDNFSNELLTAFKSAKVIKYQMTADKFVDTIHTLPDEAVSAIKKLL